MTVTIITTVNIKSVNKCLNTRDAALKFIFLVFGYQFGINYTSFYAKCYLPPDNILIYATITNPFLQTRIIWLRRPCISPLSLSTPLTRYHKPASLRYPFVSNGWSYHHSPRD